MGKKKKKNGEKKGWPYYEKLSIDLFLFTLIVGIILFVVSGKDLKFVRRDF